MPRTCDFASSMTHRRQGEVGFTLIEVAFSLLIVSVGVVSVLLILPMGVTAQVRSRQQTVATALAVNLMDMAYNQPLPKWLRTPTGVFRTKHTVEAQGPSDEAGDYYIPFVPDVHFVGDFSRNQNGPPQVNPAQVTGTDQVANPALREKNFFTARRYSTLYPDPVVHAPDLETILNTYYHGVFALPAEIARRFDSQGDEISRILDLGGQLYFIGPRAADYKPRTDGSGSEGILEPIPDEIQNLVFAVVGFPQRNAELFCMDGMFPGYVDQGENFPRAIRLYPPVSDTGAAPLDGPTKQASVKPAAGATSSVHFGPVSQATASTPSQPAMHFNPAERCRQIVFWRVDWRSYVDCENVTLAAVDRYRHPVFDLTDPVPDPRVRNRSMPPDANDPQYFRPERWFLYPGDSGYTVSVGGESGYGVAGANLWQDLHWSPIRLGRNGADLNGNRIVDRGPTDRSRRLRADLVTRFNYYDPRVWLTINTPIPPDELP